MDLPPQNDRPSGLLNFGVMALRGLHVMWIRELEFGFVYFGDVVIAFASLILGETRMCSGWRIQDGG